jgi:hypothetical protein
MSNINVNNITPIAGTSGTVSVSGSLLVSGSITANGNIVLWDSTADSVSLGAEVSSSIVPDARNVYNLGSATKGWSTLFLREITGSGVPGTFSASLSASLDIVPSATNVYNLGSSTRQWKDLYTVTGIGFTNPTTISTSTTVPAGYNAVIFTTRYNPSITIPAGIEYTVSLGADVTLLNVTS